MVGGGWWVTIDQRQQDSLVKFEIIKKENEKKVKTQKAQWESRVIITVSVIVYPSTRQQRQSVSQHINNNNMQQHGKA